MAYEIKFMPGALKDLRTLPKHEYARIVAKIEGLRNGLTPAVKRLTNFTLEYRLRVGSYRVLFEVERERIMVYRVLHRKDAYR